MSFIYLGQPYTHAKAAIREQRYFNAARYTASQLRIGQHIYSPIVHCHQLAIDFELPKNFEFWRDYNFSMLRMAKSMHILQMPGWEESLGLNAEIELAETLSIPIEYITEERLIRACKS